MQNGINLSCTIGVSAGALNAISYVSGQIGRSARFHLRYRHDPHFVGLNPILSQKERGIIGFDFLFDKLNEIEPLDSARFMSESRRLLVVCTALASGLPVYFEKRDSEEEIMTAIRASASMPYVSQPVSVRGIRCLDGGCSVKIPFEWPITHGYKKVVVVRTRERTYRAPRGEDERMPAMFYGEFPEFCAVLSKMNERYNQELDALDQLEKEGRAFVIAPSIPVTSGRLESDMDKLGELYFMGMHDAKQALPALRLYLSSQEQV